MKELLVSRITLIWFVLLGSTFLSWEVGHGLGFETVAYASMAIIAISFIKVRFVMMEFMELREAPLFMRLITDGWLIAITLVLVVLYLRPATVV